MNKVLIFDHKDPSQRWEDNRTILNRYVAEKLLKEKIFNKNKNYVVTIAEIDNKDIKTLKEIYNK